MKTFSIAAKWLLILCLPVLLLTASIALAVNSQWLYQTGFERYDVSRTTGLAQTELNKVATGLIRYFNSGEETINLVVEKDGKRLHEQEFVVQTHPPSVVEMRRWLEDCGFEIISLWGDNADEVPYTDESGRATFWARKKE